MTTWVRTTTENDFSANANASTGEYGQRDAQSMEAAAGKPQDAGWAQEAWAQAKGAGFAFYRALVVVVMWLVVFCPVWIAGLLVLRWVVKAAAAKPKTPAPPPPPIQL